MQVHEDRITPDAALAGLSFDALEYGLFVINLENAFAIATNDREIARLCTIQDVANYAKRIAFAQLIEALV